ncbi:MAG TPA: MBL fold metallo-hydrolase [Thermoanaerobaculia bacterium]|jgi:7,8-dihydropterin-6-yl-methyl-4-(beta-D-ribofuranosyl)aminobenzene 5'-phosphate synthase|nr:MBL fold metallo-hydrolase [Thermoanaerobaculia bacterium]
MRRAIPALLTLTLIASCGVQFPVRAQAAAPSAGVTLANVYDAFGAERKGLAQDFGFSCVVNYKGKWILFDSGTDARIFERNLKAMKIDLRKIDIAIVSHGHYDHIGGFDYLLSVNPKVKIYLPNDFFSLGAPTKFPFREPEPDVAKTLPKDEQYFRGERVVEGMVTVPTGRFWKSNVEYVTEAKEVLPGVTLIPTTSKLMGTFIKYPPFGDEHPQFVGMPELSASFATGKGEIILAGCSHSTIETIIQEAQKVRKGKIYLVAGGFHLIPYGREYIEGLAKRMHEQYGVEAVAPAHCTGHLAFSVFHKVFGDQYKFFGLGETLSL